MLTLDRSHPLDAGYYFYSHGCVSTWLYIYPLYTNMLWNFYMAIFIVFITAGNNNSGDCGICTGMCAPITFVFHLPLLLPHQIENNICIKLIKISVTPPPLPSPPPPPPPPLVLQLYHRLEPGEAMTFNNRRMLHSRAAFQTNGGVRHFKVCMFMQHCKRFGMYCHDH